MLFTGFGLISTAIQSKEREGFKSGVFKGLLTVTVAFEYVVIFKSFPLIVELILVPVLVVASAMFFMAEKNKEFSATVPVFGFILGVIGLTALWHSISDIYHNPVMFFSIDTLRDFFLPIFLTIGCIPSLFWLFLHSNYQQFNIRMNQKTYHSDDMRKFAKQRLLLAFGFSPRLLH